MSPSRSAGAKTMPTDFSELRGLLRTLHDSRTRGERPHGPARSLPAQSRALAGLSLATSTLPLGRTTGPAGSPIGFRVRRGVRLLEIGQLQLSLAGDVVQPFLVGCVIPAPFDKTCADSNRPWPR